MFNLFRIGVKLVVNICNVVVKRINEFLWDVEDSKRECERRKCFDDRFIQLYRYVYFSNDQRAAIKRDINKLLGSAVIEEKSYGPYWRLFLFKSLWDIYPEALFRECIDEKWTHTPLQSYGVIDWADPN